MCLIRGVPLGSAKYYSASAESEANSPQHIGNWNGLITLINTFDIYYIHTYMSCHHIKLAPYMDMCGLFPIFGSDVSCTKFEIFQGFICAVVTLEVSKKWNLMKLSDFSWDKLMNHLEKKEQNFSIINILIKHLQNISNKTVSGILRLQGPNTCKTGYTWRNWQGIWILHWQDVTHRHQSCLIHNND